MPVQLTWQQAPTPSFKQVNGRSMELRDLVQRGLEISGEEAQLVGPDPSKANVVDGRIKLLEIAGKGKEAGKSEPSASRLIATFHGKFHSDPKAARNVRVTFEIFLGKGSAGDHSQFVGGFDPECVFGVDAVVLTFVNREFVIFFPFHVDTDREGSFLELVAVAEIGPLASATEIARSSVLNVGIRRIHAVDTTSNLASGAALSYTGEQIGNVVLTPEGYMLPVFIAKPGGAADEILTDPGFMDVSLPDKVVTFKPYTSGSMKILLLVDLLDGVVPPDSFLLKVGGVNAGNLSTVRASCLTHLRGLKAVVQALFVDAGFTGATALWSDEPAAATLLAEFKTAFTRRTLGGQFWDLLDAKKPLDTSFWNFFVASSSKNQAAGQGEHRSDPLVQRKINGKDVWVQEPFPIAGGNKKLSSPIEIEPSVFQRLLMDFSGVPRKYDTVADFEAATDKVAAKYAILIAHEVAHSLGQMHHSKVIAGKNYSEQFGAPVLSIMASDVESSGFGSSIKFGAQTKVVWAAAFGVTNSPDDAFLANKVWNDAEVFTLSWGDRTNRFLSKQGEGGMGHISLDTGQTPPPFAKSPPDAQRGTFVPKP